MVGDPYHNVKPGRWGRLSLCSLFYVGRAVVALASDPGVSAKSGRTFGSWDLQREYGFADIDGSRPDWGRYAAGKDFGAAQQASHERFLRACAGDIDRE